jgi:hypothetical protein
MSPTTSRPCVTACLQVDRVQRSSSVPIKPSRFSQPLRGDSGTGNESALALVGWMLSVNDRESHRVEDLSDFLVIAPLESHQLKLLDRDVIGRRRVKGYSGNEERSGKIL